MGSKLFVGNLPWGATSEDLTAFFGEGVLSVKVIADRETGRSRGFAFIEAESEVEAKRIIDSFNGVDFQGRELRINEAEERQRSGGGGGGGRGYAPPQSERRPTRERRRGRGGKDDRDSW
jgi:RNA recognition motif-containing protein